MQTKIGTDVQQAARILSSGGLVAIPTETVYGLAANALDARAALKIFEAKKRPSFDPLIVHVSSFHELQKYAAQIPSAAASLATRYWPGPLTLVLPKQEIIPDVISSGLPTVGLRVPDHPLTLQLLRSLPFPLAAPSANPFGYISPTTALHVMDQLGEEVDYILDGGACAVGVESTIVGFENDRAVIYRLGGLSVEDIRKVVPDASLKINTSSNPQAPGMLASHYAPRKQFILGDLQALVSSHAGKKLGVLSFTGFSAGGENIIQREVLSPDGDLFEAASGLFAAMRRLDAGEADVILSEPVPEISIGRAINDRLRRAAG